MFQDLTNLAKTSFSSFFAMARLISRLIFSFERERLPFFSLCLFYGTWPGQHGERERERGKRKREKWIINES